ncbi:MAG TPA: hypothetical protein ENN23_01260 [Deltaproteobacteria bacterium]|nr:hypothetical protein [Deltaproteobacteria bacterium]
MKSRYLQTAMEKNVSSVQVKQESHIIVLRVSDIPSAAAQVEKILAEYSAEKVSLQSIDGKAVFKGDLAKDKTQDFIRQLKSIYQVEEKNPSIDNIEEDISIIIEIMGK